MLPPFLKAGVFSLSLNFVCVLICLQSYNVVCYTFSMAKEKEVKTNVMRILDKNKISYEAFSYEVDEFVDGIHCADAIGVPHEQSFKTLVAQGRSKEYYVFVLPIEKEVDLKTAAKAVGEKSVEMIHVKDINKITGYIRGGCSPLGMKKQYMTVIDESALSYDWVYVSGGRIGSTVKVNPRKLASLCKAAFYNICE